MNVELEPGTYVVAVSGGVDSMVLLDLLTKQNQSSVLSPQSSVKTGDGKQKTDGSNRRFVVAHFDHGIRHDSVEDRRLVQAAAKQYGLKFVYDEGNLGPETSEAAARDARYGFLDRLRTMSGARAIITAHHQDDLLETAILNLLRGTGRRGLTSLKSTDIIKRPLLYISKKDLIGYAKQHNLTWREDETNQDTRFRRNYIRHKILPAFSPTYRQMLIGIIKSLQETNEQIDKELDEIYQQIAQGDNSHIDRHSFIILPHSVAREVMLAWLRQHDVSDITSKTLERLVIAGKTLRPGQRTDVDKQYVLEVSRQALALSRRDR